MGSIYRRGNKIWLRIKGPNGKWQGLPTDFVVGQEKLARAALELLEARIKAGTAAAGELGPVTVQRYYDATWLPARKRNVRTWANDEYAFRLYALPALGSKKLAEVRPSHLVALVDSLKPKMAGKSVWNVYASVTALFRDAALSDLITSTPCILTDVQLGSREPADPEFRHKAHYSRPELEQLISDERIPMDRRVLYGLLGVAGVRYGEAAGLRWRNALLPQEPLQALYIAFSYANPYPKGGRCRAVPVLPALASLLAEWKLSGWRQLMKRDPLPDDLVVPRPPDDVANARLTKNPEMRSKTFIRDRLVGDLALLGFRHRRGHDLRHTFIGLARSDGARTEILRRVTHKPPPEVIEGYTFFEWPVVCAEVEKLKVQRRGTKRISTLPVAVGDFATGLLQSAGSQQIHWHKGVAHPGLEPGRR